MKPPMDISPPTTSAPPTSTSITLSALEMWVRIGMKKARTRDMRIALSRTARLSPANRSPAQRRPR